MERNLAEAERLWMVRYQQLAAAAAKRRAQDLEYER